MVLRGVAASPGPYRDQSHRDQAAGAYNGELTEEEFWQIVAELEETGWENCTREPERQAAA